MTDAMLHLDRFSRRTALEPRYRRCALAATCREAYDENSDECDGDYPARTPDDFSACYIAKTCVRCGDYNYDDEGECPGCHHKVGEKA